MTEMTAAALENSYRGFVDPKQEELILVLDFGGQTAQLIARLREGASPFPTTSSTSSLICHVPTSSSDLQNKECICTTQTCGAGMVDAAAAVAAAAALNGVTVSIAQL